LPFKAHDLRSDLSFGARVEGLDWRALADPSVRAELKQIFEERGLIVFEDVEQTAKMQVAISQVFGPIKDLAFSTDVSRDHENADLGRGVLDLHYKPSDDPNNTEGLVEIDGRRLARFNPWHFDHCYTDRLNRGGVLRAVVNPPTGGRTGFMDGVDLYARFPKDLRDRLGDLKILYTLDIRFSAMRFGVTFTPLADGRNHVALLKEAASLPRALHPAVWTRAGGQ